MRRPATCCLLLATVVLSALARPSAATGTMPTTDNPLQKISVRYAVPPRYPDAALTTCAHGTARVKVRVDEQGRTRRIDLETSSGNEHLDEAAVAVVRAWQFLPSVVDGVPNGGEVVVPIAFQDPCPLELDVSDPGVRGLVAPPGWSSATSPQGWEPYEVASGRAAHPPKYPKAATKQCAGGVVQVRVTVAANGYVRNVAVAQTSGNADLDAAALEAARHWLYRPGRHGEKVVGGDVMVPVQFKAPC